MAIRSRILMATVFACAFGTAAMAQVAGEKIRDQYICVFKNDSEFTGGPAAAARSAAQFVGADVRHVYTTAIKGFSARMSERAATRLQEVNLNIAFCEQDQVVTVAPVQASAARTSKTTTQPAQATPWGITRVGGGVAGTFKRAWVIDSGIAAHPDLRIDTTVSRSFLSGTTSFADENGHGTHVAGTIAALNNTIGVVGVAPNAPVVSIRVLDRRGSGSNSGVIAGVDYVAQFGVEGDVANMSLGGGVSAALDAAVLKASARVLFVLAAGNSAADANLSSPARVNGPNIFTVSAFDSGNAFASFSNFGNPPVDWAAPGVSVRSTWLGGGYNTISGTSMAAPHVAGLLLHGRARVVADTDTSKALRGDPDGTVDPIAIYR